MGWASTAVIAQDPAAISLHVLASTWASRNRTNWFLPSSQPSKLLGGHDAAERWAALLVTCRLLAEVDGGYLIGDLDGLVRRITWRPAIPAWLRALVFARDGYKCVTCGATDDLTLDHIYPWSLGGPDVEENLRVLCRPCNSRKGAKV